MGTVHEGGAERFAAPLDRDAQLVGGGAYSPAAGTPAILTSGNVEPFAVAAVSIRWPNSG